MRKICFTAITIALCFCGCIFVHAENRDLIKEVKSSVKNNWNKLADYSSDIVGLQKEMKSLPDSSWWFWEKDKKDQQKTIVKHLHKVRSILLSTDACEIMRKVDIIDQEIAGIDREICATREKSQLDPQFRAEHEAKLQKLTDKKVALEGVRRQRAAVVCAELRTLGLNIGSGAAENCIFTVNFGDIIDGVVVSKNIACVIENLRELMMSGDINSARRYFGMYLVMVDVQIDYFEAYLEKSRHGEWRLGINRIKDEAKSARETALKSMKDADFTQEQQEIFRNNAKVNESTIEAANAYLKVLDAHEKVIEDKLTIAQRIRRVVDNSLETVNLAGDFVRLAKSNQEAFDSLLQLDLPPIAIFSDASVQQEFTAITQKLKE